MTDIHIAYIIKRTICEYYDITIEDIEGRSRKGEIAKARHTAIKLTKEFTSAMPLKSIGKEYGGRDHTTVLHSIGSYNNLYDTEANTRTNYHKLKELITSKIDAARENDSEGVSQAVEITPKQEYNQKEAIKSRYIYSG